MEYLKKFRAGLRSRLLGILILDNLVVLADWWLVTHVLRLNGYEMLAAIIVVPLIALTLLPWLSVRYLAQPTRLIAEAILHIAPDTAASTPSPDPNSARFGKELVASLTHDVYQLATLTAKIEGQAKASSELKSNFIIDNLPLPILLLDAQQNVKLTNQAAGRYFGIVPAEILDKNLYSLLDMSFPSAHTFDSWLADVREHNATAVTSWERVRLAATDNHPQQLFDLAAYYNKDNPTGLETILVFFDHTKTYSQDDQAISFIALSVHELRTPLTLLRGYIEAFEDEFAGKLDPQMNDFMFKMSATAQQLTAFVNNILNVARVDDDQLELHLHEEAWGDIIRSAANALALRAKVRGITLEYSIAPGLPTVGADRVSIIEVINNLVDNAIKYSGSSTRIRISANLNSEGMVETTVEDYGIGIPANIIPKLFTKFYRDHHNRAQIGGTGLGLYLSKAIVSAHGGNIWVKSKVGEGSIFGFTLQPYAKLADGVKNSDNKDIVRGAHGWIKNHSLYRR
ncbi:MAG TPA: ATP-binding protein [Candidatus Saccharimonadales bacterium]